MERMRYCDICDAPLLNKYERICFPCKEKQEQEEHSLFKNELKELIRYNPNVNILELTRLYPYKSSKEILSTLSELNTYTL